VALTLPGWSQEAERSFKEVLFRFLEDVHCTKAALYLRAPDGDYLLATQYGFGRKDLLCAQYPPSSTIVVTASKLKSRAHAFNDPGEIPEIYESLQGSHSSRMLLVPVHQEDELLGFVDARDKGGKKEFNQQDEEKAAVIAEDLVQLIRMTGMVQGVSTRTPVEIPVTTEETRSDSKPPKRVLERSRTGSGMLDLPGLRRIGRCLDDELASRKELGIGVLTLVDDRKVSSRILVVDGFDDDALDPVFFHQAEILRSAGITVPPREEWSSHTERIERELPHRPFLIGSRTLLEEKNWVLLLSLVGSARERTVPEAFERIENVTLEEVSASWCRFSRRKHAREILQPAEGDFSLLARHSLAVSRLSWSLAMDMGLGYEEAEAAALAGLLHDIGMQVLEYDRNYRHPSPGEREMQVYRKHPVEGEKIALEHGFGDLSFIIRAHHERWNGQGYPDHLKGPAIPLISRILHVAEVFDTLVSPNSYRKATSRDAALKVIESGAGSQFDPSVVSSLRGSL